MAELDIKGLGLAIGGTWAICTLFLGLAAWLFSYGTDWVSLLSNVYVGYDATLGGSILGAIYGFIDGFIGGVLIAWLYNKFASN